MDFVNGTSSYFLFFGRKPLCELATGQGMLKQALLLFLVTFEVYMVEIPDDYYGKRSYDGSAPSHRMSTHAFF